MKPLTTPRSTFVLFSIICTLTLVATGCTSIDGQVIQLPNVSSDLSSELAATEGEPTSESQPATAANSTATESTATESATAESTAAGSITVAQATATQLSPTQTATAQNTSPQSTPLAQIITDVSNYIIPTPVPTAQSYAVARVATSGARANIRSGPGSTYDIIAKGPSNSTYTVVSSSPDQQWWQICCVEGTGDSSGSPSTYGWVATSVVSIEGSLDTVATDPLLNTSMQSQWDVKWSCESERCDVRDCTAIVDGIGRDLVDQQWLDINHRVTWSNSCFSTDDWNFEVNLYTGDERTNSSPDNFLYRYWIGEQGNRINSVVALPDGRSVAAWCSGGERVEVPEAEGWKTVYIGKTCHDARTGMLLTLSYQKQWLFTGEFAGNSYVDAFFGDLEVLEQSLAYTNAQLLFVSER